jgi:adenylate cyclase
VASEIRLDSIRPCFEGLIPSLLASCSPDGTPNVTYVSQVHYVDADHVALTYQFFNKTRQNILAHPYATVWVGDTVIGTRYRLELQYLRTEESGPTFESMKARLAGIASHSGMAGVFKLRGADIYRVLGIEMMPGSSLRPAPRRFPVVSAVRQIAARINAAGEMDALLGDTLAALEEFLDVRHAKLLLDSGARNPPRLYTVASRGYPASGVGSEIPFGDGVIGVAAEQRVPVRIMHFTSEYTYSCAARERWMATAGASLALETEIPLPGLEEPQSQLAVPIQLGRRLIGVLYVESEHPARFGFEDEDALLTVAAQLGATIVALQAAADESSDVEDTAAAAQASAPAASRRASGSRGQPIVIRHFAENDSVFVDDEYLIKGVAGAILWKLVRERAKGRSTEFTNRELRLDSSLGLPELSDNLEARLILLARRLEERTPALRIAKTGRGRFRLEVARPLELVEVSS